MSSKTTFAMRISLNQTPIFTVLTCFSMVHVFGYETESRKFDVKPGGARNHFETVTRLGISCKFTYACQGGTNEEWISNLSSEDDINYECVFGRRGRFSYLYFQEFQIDVTGANIKSANVMDSYRNLMTPNQFIVDTDKKIVRYREGIFQSKLYQINVLLTRQKGKRWGLKQ